jgi:hypothetical protein
MSSTRTLAFIAGGILVLVAISVAIVLLAGGRQRQEFAAGSPEATVQDYLAAWEEQDPAAAWTFYSSEVQAEYGYDEFERAANDYFRYSGQQGTSRSVFIDGVDGSGERVTVRLTVEEYYSDGLNNNSYRSPRTVRLIREDGSWKLRDPLIWLDPAPFPEPGLKPG